MTTLLRTYDVRALHRRALLRGAASAMDLRGSTLRQYTFGRHPETVDCDAIRADFEAVGADLRAALDQYSERH